MHASSPGRRWLLGVARSARTSIGGNLGMGGGGGLAGVVNGHSCMHPSMAAPHRGEARQRRVPVQQLLRRVFLLRPRQGG